MKLKSVAFIPARSGSKRVPNKNIKLLGGHPLLAYTIRSAIDSGVFSAVICATDSQEYAEVACRYGAEVPMLRPATISGDKSPDIEWVEWILEALYQQGREFDAFSILRPTSPFRKPETIRRAWAQFTAAEGVDSLRAVEKCQQHPGKMWVLRGERMMPLMPLSQRSNLGTALSMQLCPLYTCRTRAWRSPGRAWCTKGALSRDTFSHLS